MRGGELADDAVIKLPAEYQAFLLRIVDRIISPKAVTARSPRRSNLVGFSTVLVRARLLRRGLLAMTCSFCKG